MSLPSGTTSEPSSADAIYERLLNDIISGKYPADTWLPAERELTEIFGVSRPTIREAVKRLAALQVVSLKKGHRVRICEARSWAFEVIPSYLRAGAPLSGGIGRLIYDLLFLRRELSATVLRMLAPHATESAVTEARGLVLAAWSTRSNPAEFVARDIDVLRALAYRCQAFPALWLLNSVFEIYLELARRFALALDVPSEYTTVYMAVLDAVEAHDGDRAASILLEYLQRHDGKLTPLLGLGA